MTPRERHIENEKLILSEYGFRSENSKGRKVYEAPCDFRTDFQRDRDRIIHCNSFRRLKDPGVPYSAGRPLSYTAYPHS